MPGIISKPGEPLDKLLRLFKKQAEKGGVIADIKRKDYFEKPSVRRKKKSVAARKRRAKQRLKAGLSDLG